MDDSVNSLSSKVDVLRKKQHIEELNASLRTQRDTIGKSEDVEKLSFVRIIRDGIAEEIRNAVLEAKRELEQHRKLNRLNRTATNWTLEFYELSDRFLEKKLLLERVEKALDDFRQNHAMNHLSLSDKKKLELAISNARQLRKETVQLMEDVCNRYNRLESQIKKDRGTEANLIRTFEKCLKHLTANDKRRFETLIRSKLDKLTIEGRISLLTKFIEQLAHSVPAIRREEIERLFVKAKHCFDKSMYQEAQKVLDQVFTFDRKHLESHRLRAEIYKQLNNRFAHICELRMITEIPHAEGQDFHRLAENLLQDGKVDDAIVLYEKAVEREPTLEFQLLLGDLCLERKIWYRAVQVYETILKKNPRLTAVRHKLGQALYEINQETEAFDQLRKSVKNNDNQALSRVYLGRIYRKRFQFNEAVSCFERAIALEPTNPEGYYWFGMMLYDEGKFDVAFDKASQVLTYEPTRTRNQLFFARCCNALGMFDKAIETLKPYVNQATPSADLVLAYTEACKHLQVYDDAISVLSTLVKKFPRQPQLRSELGLLMLETGRYQDANHYLKPAV